MCRGKRRESIRYRIKVRVRQITGPKNKLNQHLRVWQTMSAVTSWRGSQSKGFAEGEVWVIG